MSRDRIFAQRFGELQKLSHVPVGPFRWFSTEIGLAYRSEWEKQNIQSLSKVPVWYTDGSKTSSGTAGGVFGSKTGWVFSPGAFVTVFQA